MTKKRIHIDDFFRRGLGNMQLPIDGNDWFAVQASLAAAQRAKKRRIMWLWVVGVLLLAGAGTGIYQVSNKNVNPEIITQQQTIAATEQQENPNTFASNLDNRITQTEGNETGNSDGALGTDNKAPFAAAQSPVNSKTRLPKRRMSQLSNNGSDGKGDPDVSETTDGADFGSQSTPTVKEAESADNNEPVEAGNDETPTADSKPLVIAINDTVKPQEDVEPSLAKADSIEPEQKTTKYPTLSKFSPFSIGFNLSPTASMFAAQNQTKFGSILRNGNKSGLAIAMQVTINYNINNWSFGTGLGVTSIATRGNYRYTHQVYDSVPVLNPGGQVVGYFYTNFRDSSQNLTLNSRYTYITLPLQASYNLALTDKLGLQLGGSVQLQRLAGMSGEAISPFSLFSTDVAKQKDVLRKWNASIAIQAGGYYKLNKKWQINAGLQMSRFASGVYSNAIGTVIRPRNFGLHLGVNYNLTK